MSTPQPEAAGRERRTEPDAHDAPMDGDAVAEPVNSDGTSTDQPDTGGVDLMGTLAR